MLCRPYDEHCLPVWLGRASLTVDLSHGSNYGTFVVQWWTPMCLKKEPKSLVARECWTRRCTLKVTHPQRISVTTVLYTHRMPSHKDKGSPKMHLILEASAVMALANLANLGVLQEPGGQGWYRLRRLIPAWRVLHQYWQPVDIL